MNHANESIDDHFNRSIDDSDCFLIENSFHSFQFIDSKQKKISDLLKKKIFEFVNKRDVSSDIRVFNARFINEIKNENTKKTYEKSRLIIQTYNDSKKKSNFHSIINHSTNESTFDFMHRRHDRKRFDQIIFSKHNADVRTINFHFHLKFLRQIIS